MKTVKLELNVNEINKISLALSKCAWSEVNDLIVKIQNQAKAQLEEKPAE